ncbi:unnamed protein product [Darwinula stevensoni]|uniref:PITH domain-containing protein n=1 Tax=Darwinula stevensoni TaxID=69355 RepID=A0A7R8XA96_9CRUS|nr:unnamed protein product [Darwinula stevensoni]CAG0886468.1 unnamed protein product [Darwinula stevensoni]
MARCGDHDGCCDGESHTKNIDLGFKYSLYMRIDKENVECLNESVEGAGKKIFKAWEERKDNSKYVESDVDEELLFNIPFTGNVKLKGFIVRGGMENTHPSIVRLFKDKPNMTFDDTSAKADQEIELVQDNEGTVEYPTKVVHFSSIHHLSLHFPKNFGASKSVIYYIGLSGEWTPAHRHGVTICTYEAVPSISDHKTSTLDSVSREIQ